MSEDKPDYVSSKLKEMCDKIEAQARLFGLHKIGIDTTCVIYLSMTENELIKLTPEELALGEIRLASYGFTIQQHINRAVAIKNWADKCIRLLTAKEYNNYDKFMPYEARKDSVICNNEYAERLNIIVNEHQMIIDEFQYLSQSVQHLSDSFGRLAKIRRKDP